MRKNLLILVLLFLICALTVSFAYIYEKTPVAEDNNDGTKLNRATESVDLDLLTLNDTIVHIKDKNRETQLNRDPDLDLTALSSTIVFAKVYNMMSTPENYTGKVIKASGLYSYIYYQEFDKYYHFIIVADAGGCCEQRLEFLWSGDNTYPDDYPKVNERIELTGVFTKYEDSGYTRYRLVTDSVLIRD